MNVRLLALSCVAAVGCGKVADHSYVPPYMTLHGTIQKISTDHVPTNVHVALVWEGTKSQNSHVLNVAEDVAVSNSFPTTFDLNVVSLPPPQAMTGCFETPDGKIDTCNDVLNKTGFDSRTEWGQGEIVVYEDLNQNGKLDIEPDDSTTPSPDVVIGKSEGTRVWYLDGKFKPAMGFWSLGRFPTTNGFSVTTSTLREPTIDDCVGGGQAACFTYWDHFQQLSLPASIDLTIEADSIALKQYTCGTAWGDSEWEASDYSYPNFPSNPNQLADGHLCGDVAACTCAVDHQFDPTPPTCGLDYPPPGTTATCSADGTQFIYKACYQDPTTCWTPTCHWGYGSIAAGEAKPANWPCP